MIPADAITAPDVDGRMWLVGDEWLWAEYHRYDRPCDTCDGCGFIGDRPPVDDLRCPDCYGTGRHCFGIEVEDRNTLPGQALRTTISRQRTLTVHVVPGMVLPIYDDYQTRGVPSIWINSDGDAWLHDLDESKTITLPPAAPGMWAVQLQASPW